ncbi:MAG TPA: prolyl oligopeptidase family serine peptidase [Gemmatimonadaceae bacterium]|nr:prolyl oligopeptidase family serine peptidase [Gemmatimonadaceae bacterium]
MVSVRLIGILVLYAATAAAQPVKKALTQDTYDSWRTISGATLSPDGRWTAYTLSPVVGNGEFVLRATSGNTEYRTPRGWTGRPVVSVTVDSPFVAPPPSFSGDSRFAAVLAYAPQADFDAARRRRARPADQPKNRLILVRLGDGQVTNIARVRAFRLPRESTRWIVYHHEADSGAAPDTARRGPRRKDPGSVLVVRDLESGNESRIPDVASYVVDDSAKWLAYAVSSRSGSDDGVYLRALGTEQVIPVMRGEANYKQLAFDRAGTQLAFVSDKDEFGREKAKYALYYATTKAPTAAPVAATLEGMAPSERGSVSFSRNGAAIIYGVASPQLDSIPADSLADKAVFDLWHWQDARLQPQQLRELTRDRNRTWTGVYHIAAKSAVRLTNDSLPSATLSEDARTALAVTSVPYAVAQMWGAGGSDVVLIDAISGKRTRIATKLGFSAQLSPGAKYVAWYDDGRWHSYAVATGKTVDLTGAIKGVRFDDEEHDSPSTPGPYGLAGWTRDDRSLLVHTRYDVWEVDPAGVRPPRVVTDSLGVRSRLELRVMDLDPEDRFIDPTAPLLLRAFDTKTKAMGVYRDRLDGAASPPVRITMVDAAFGNPQKARKASQILVTRSTVSDFPNLWTGPGFDQLTKISDANPQQSSYAWPTVELVEWLSNDGVPLQGLLYKPEGFDASRKYPMVVYYYERLSDGLHQYHAPAGRNTVNPSVYTSLGYLVFFPDIVYKPGWPGPSAVSAIVPGVHSLIGRGFVNPKAVGIAGQSWGGYQSAYVITQTTMFAAAVPNAPVANMTSAYGGIRWESGLARPFQYEKTQSRIGGSIWEYPVRFIENSPLFHLDRVTTPVLFMHNDADGAVPWYQGIELFVGLRRLGKEVYMLNYNGDGHNPRKRANQKDIDMRMQQFFANKLKGEPAPDWMVRGIPALEKGRDQIAPKAATTSSPIPESPKP